jgi:hypothetical protein
MRHLEALNLPVNPQPTSTPAVMGQLRFEQPFPQHQVVGLENPAEWLKGVRIVFYPIATTANNFYESVEEFQPSTPQHEVKNLQHESLQWLRTRDVALSGLSQPLQPRAQAMVLAPRSQPRTILPPSPKVLSIIQELLRMPHAPLTPEQAKKQVKEHLSEAKQQMLKSGRMSTGS